MCEIIKTTERVARKEYECNASLYLQDALYMGDWSFTDRRIIVKARRDNWQIKPGQRYLEARWRTDYGLETIRQRIDVHELCLRNDLYDGAEC